MAINMSVEKIYETACAFLELPDMARYIVGTFFGVIDWELLKRDEDEHAATVFRSAHRRKELTELNDHIRRQKGTTNASHSKLH
jgi:hypothetical protein